MDRNSFLERVRGELQDGPPGPALPVALPRTFASGDGRLVERFAAELEAVGGTATLVTPTQIAEAVATRAQECRTAVVDRDVPSRDQVLEGLARAGCEPVEPGRGSAAVADLGITRAEIGVAATGSVLLAAAPEALRTTGLLPPSHIVVLPRERLVPGFEELFEQMPGFVAASSQLVLVTGPSRTSDIEMTLVRGVHGPGRVAVLVVSA
jgi:L-lactate dehydrogenase complex protein LldG